MIRLIILILLIFVISSALVWMIENNGSLEIVWLGYLIKTDILTSLIIVALLYVALAIFWKIISGIFSVNLKALFSPNKLKKLSKLLQKDEQSFNMILSILQNLENGDNKEALQNHKQLTKTSNNEELNDFLLAKIYYCLEDYKKSQEIASKLENSESSILILASELELALKKKDKTNISHLVDEIIEKSPHDSQSKTLKKAIDLKIRDLIALRQYQEAKDVLKERKMLKQDPELIELFVLVNNALASEAFEKKSFISAIHLANKALKFDENHISSHEIKIKSWLALGFVMKARSDAKKQFKKTKKEIFVTLFSDSYQGQSEAKITKAIQKFVGTSKIK
ncbi:MAG: heme biosynthesis HemY N-terminal domain-containing protein [Rickettsiales bacterium]|nr:heme biosynthesis HemY N-terminal domain-containing protein [Rickettsiales bacterium]